MPYRSGSLKYQVNQIFARGHAIGESKHAAKRERDTEGRVFAVRTDWDYRDGALYFARWASERHGCHDVAAALRRPDWGQEWAERLAAQGKAASTRKAYLSGAAKACAIVASSLRSAWTDVIASVGRRTPPPPRGYGANAKRVLAAVGEASHEAMLILELALATGARIGELVRTRPAIITLCRTACSARVGCSWSARVGSSESCAFLKCYMPVLRRWPPAKAATKLCSRSQIVTYSVSCVLPASCSSGRRPVRTGSATISPRNCEPVSSPTAGRPRPPIVMSLSGGTGYPLAMGTRAYVRRPKFGRVWRSCGLGARCF
jgi:hypothetical protein